MTFTKREQEYISSYGRDICPKRDHRYGRYAKVCLNGNYTYLPLNPFDRLGTHPSCTIYYKLVESIAHHFSTRFKLDHDDIYSDLVYRLSQNAGNGTAWDRYDKKYSLNNYISQAAFQVAGNYMNKMAVRPVIYSCSSLLTETDEEQSLDLFDIIADDNGSASFACDLEADKENLVQQFKLNNTSSKFEKLFSFLEKTDFEEELTLKTLNQFQLDSNEKPVKVTKKDIVEFQEFIKSLVYNC